MNRLSLLPQPTNQPQQSRLSLANLGRGPDYDYAGYVQQYGIPDQSKGQHLTDEYKLPAHITFSSGSKYNNAKNRGGEWIEENGQWHFYASPDNLRYYQPEELTEYFKRYEPDAVLHLPTTLGTALRR